MSSPAAFLGSQKSVGVTIQGSPNVFVGTGLAAHRLGDLGTCLEPGPVIAIVPTVGNCSTNVFANGQPMARIGSVDSGGCVIIQGSPTVLIGG